MKTITDMVQLVETWDVQKKLGREFNQKDMRRFMETMNDRTRQLISIVENTSPDFWSSLQELAMHAATLTTAKARVIADGVDRTNV